MSFFGVELNAQINKITLQIKLHLAKNKYLPNFRTIYQSLANFDPDQTGWVSPLQFQKALNQNGIFLKNFQWQAIEKAFAHQGTINWFAFIANLREPLNAQRFAALEATWQTLDPNNTGKVHISILNEKFQASQFKEFKLGHKSKDTILKQFLNLVPISSDYFISQQQFYNFYTDLSINLPSDNAFANFITSQWGATYHPQPLTTNEQVQATLRAIRYKLLQGTNNTHQEFILRKLFNEFDVDKSGRISLEELKVMLVKLEIPAEERLLKPVIDKLSHAKNDLVDFEDFQQFLFHHPYHF